VTVPSVATSVAGTAPPSRRTIGYRRGELGRWPVVVALALIAVGFQLANDAFLSPRNLSNLMLQTATLAILTLGVMLVLVLGEIDLSIGAVSGFTACIMGILSALAGWPAWAAIVVALALGAAIGFAQGGWVVVFGAPSFIVTLAGMLVWQGLQLLSLQSQNGQLRIEDSFITGLATTYLPPAAGWALGIVVIVAGLGLIVVRRAFTARSGYDTEPLRADVFRAILVVAVPLVILLVLDRYLGVPYLLVITLAITGALSLITSSTVFGRHLYAVGGNAEAAHRTGVRVGALRIVIFTLVSTLAAVAGILSAARGYSVSVNTGGGNTTLNAIAAAVIGGTSLFGGRGTIVGALLGALVISSVQNGLALIGQTAATQVITTGLILLAAVTLDTSVRGRWTRWGFR
jgi:D-xylose transport system permease protein